MTTTETTLLDINSLLAGEWTQCKTLLEHSYPLNQDSSSSNKISIDNNHLINLLSGGELTADQTLIEFIQSLLEPVETLSPEAYALLRFIDQLFSNYTKNAKLHPVLIQQLKPLRTSCAKSLLNQQLPWQQSLAISSGLKSIYANSIGWQPELGRAADRYLKQLSPLISDFTNTSDADRSITALKSFFGAEQQRIQKLEKRLYDAELGALHSKHAQQLSARTLNQQMAGKQLPATISAFLQGPWRESMRLLIISNGKDSEPWRRILRLTETLVWSFQPIKDESENYRQDVLQSISELSEQLREITIGLHHSNKLDEELALVESEHLKILKGEPLSYQPFELIDNTDPLVSAQVFISNSLIKQASSYDEGQWFFHHSDDGIKRIKLTVKITQAHQLLFTNFAGMKVSHYSFEEFAYMLSSKIVIPVKTRDPFKATGEKIINSLLLRYQQQQQQAASEASIEEEILRQQELTRKAAREKALQEAREFIQAQKLARLKSQQEELKRSEQQAAEQHEQNIHTDLSQLNIGATIIFYDENQQGDHCKLAAIIQSTNVHIFVNRQGLKQHSLNKNQLTDRLLDGSAKIIDLGSDFENTLEQVVNNLRTRK